VALEAPAPPPGAQPQGQAATARQDPGRAGTDLEPRVATGPKVTRVVAANVSLWQRFAEIWRSRELLVYLVRTEIKVKYKNSFLGLVWSMIAPAMTLVVYTIVFGYFLKNGIPNFVIFLFSGLLLWNFFQTGVISGTGVVVNNAGLVKKVSFPREILALAAIGSAGVYLFFQACVMVIFMLVLHVSPDWPLLWLLLVAVVPTVVFSASLAVFFASINVYLRDTQHLVEVLVGAAWFWACPIVYSYQLEVADKLAKHHLFGWSAVNLKEVFFLNPVTPLVMTFQRVLYNRMGLVRLTSPGHPLAKLLPSWPPSTYLLADGIVLAVSVVMLILAMVIFGRLAGNFAEEL
jgi:ABC-2 type transport system permease protein